jgi:ABC-type multidrug transport system fused ATPase/permease subunit
MFKNRLKKIENSGLGQSIRVLSKTDRRKLFLIVALQSAFNILDLMAIAAIGMIGALTIRGVTSQTPGDRVSLALQVLHIDGQSLQRQVLILTFVAMFLFVSRTILSVSFTKRTLRFLSNRSAQLTSLLFSKTMNQPLTTLQQNSEQSTLYALTNGVSIIFIGILGAFATLISDLTLLAIIFSGMIFVDPVTALSAFAFFGLLGLLMYLLLHKKARELGRLDYEFTVQGNQQILEAIGAFREIFVLNRRAAYISALRKTRVKLAQTTSEISFIPYISKYVLESAVILGGVIIAGIQFAVNDANRAIATLAIFLAAGTRIGPAVLRVQQGAIQIRGNLAVTASSFELIKELENCRPTPTQNEMGLKSRDLFDARVELVNCSFRYPEARINAINNLSLTISKGDFIVLVGASGSGKSTLVDLILGILEPQEGYVAISSESPGCAISNWPGAIGYVPQNVMLLNGTIRANILLGLNTESVEEKRIREVLGIVQLTDFVESLPLGLDSEVGDRGAKLSGGQRQRIGIARAILTEPMLLVLDEATSALDGTTEASITESISSLKGKMTVIVIAHRLSSVKHAEKVVFLKEGSIAEIGSFDEVRAKVPEFESQINKMELN